MSVATNNEQISLR